MYKTIDLSSLSADEPLYYEVVACKDCGQYGGITLRYKHPLYWLVCYTCGNEARWASTIEKAVKLWNEDNNT